MTRKPRNATAVLRLGIRCYTPAALGVTGLFALSACGSSASVRTPHAAGSGTPQYDTYLAPALSAIQAAGKAQPTRISSSGAVLASVQQVKSNPQLLAMVGVNPLYLAWTMADSVFRMHAGQLPPEHYPVLNRAFTKQNVNSLDLTAAAESSGEWFGSTAYRQAFEKLWGAK